MILSPPLVACSSSTARETTDPSPADDEEDRVMTPLVRGLVLVVVIGLVAVPGGAAASSAAMAAPAPYGGRTALGWLWPVRGARIAAPYAAPAHAYGPGHRGVDLQPRGGDAHVRSPADGVVAFSGMIAGRGILTIDHGGGLVTTLEPIASELHPGDAVSSGEEVGEISLGGHAPVGAIHFGVRLNGEYINPLLLLGGVPRAILLPCCE